MSKLIILKHDEIILKLDRIAWQITEEYYNEKEIIIIGIKARGFAVAELINAKLKTITDAKINLVELVIDKDNALESEVVIPDAENIRDKAIVLVDDVLNSGYTLAGAFKEILENKPKYVKVAVLANRDHKAFPIHADFVGISLATTLKEHISFEQKNGQMTVYLV